MSDTRLSRKVKGLWKEPRRGKEKEDIRQYIAVHGKLLCPPHPPPTPDDADTCTHSSGKQATVRQLWTECDVSKRRQDVGGKEEKEAKVPASRYTKGVRKKSSRGHAEKENVGHQVESVVAREEREPLPTRKTTGVRREKGASSSRQKLRVPNTSTPLGSADAVETDPATSYSGQWLSSRSPKRKHTPARRQPPGTANRRRPLEALTGTGNKRAWKHESGCGVPKQLGDVRGDYESESKRPRISPDDNRLLQLSPLSGQERAVHEDAGLPLHHVSSSPSPTESIESSDLSWLDSGLPSQYRLPSLPSADLCDTNELLEELSGCEKMLFTSP